MLPNPFEPPSRRDSIPLELPFEVSGTLLQADFLAAARLNSPFLRWDKVFFPFYILIMIAIPLYGCSPFSRPTIQAILSTFWSNPVIGLILVIGIVPLTYSTLFKYLNRGACEFHNIVRFTEDGIDVETLDSNNHYAWDCMRSLRVSRIVAIIDVDAQSAGMVIIARKWFEGIANWEETRRLMESRIKTAT